jgi:hypothetical protein
MKSPTGNLFGLGIAPENIPPRAMETAREYLDKLVTVTTVEAKELSRRYRIDFTRSDSVNSDALGQNIETLQAFHSDSFHLRKTLHTPLQIP